eukprot:gene8031-9879_t
MILEIINETNKKFSSWLQTSQYQLQTLNNEKVSVFDSLDYRLNILKLKDLDPTFILNRKKQRQQKASKPTTVDTTSQSQLLKDNIINNDDDNSKQEEGVEGDEEEMRTLYDFIDINSLESIKSQTITELNLLKEICEYSEQIVIFTKNKSKELRNSLNGMQNQSNQDFYNTSFTTDLLKSQTKEVESINAIMFTIASQYDRIQFLIQQQQKNQSTLISNDTITEIEVHNENLASLVSSSYDGLQRLAKQLHESEERLKKSNQMFANCQHFLSILENLSTKFWVNWEKFENNVVSFEEHCSSADFLIGELYSLSHWYELFDSSYDQLLEEFKRREKEYQRYKSIAETYQKDLTSMFMNELQKRDRFYESFGRYLPVSFISLISDSPIQFQICQVDDVEGFKQIPK